MNSLQYVSASDINNLQAWKNHGLILILFIFLSLQDELKKYIEHHMWSPDYSPLVYPFGHV